MFRRRCIYLDLLFRTGAACIVECNPVACVCVCSALCARPRHLLGGILYVGVMVPAWLRPAHDESVLDG